MKKALINGTGIAYSLNLAGESDPWLVFSNSLATNHSIWNAQAEAFGASFNLLCYDQRGHGQSDIPDTSLNFDVLGTDLIALMDQIDVRKATAIGLSMGVPTLFSAYHQAPDRFDALVLLDGQAASAANAAETWQTRIDQAQLDGMKAFGRATASRWLTPQSHAKKLASLADMIGATDFSGFKACAQALQAYDYQHVLAACKVPVLGLAGENDGAMPDTMRRYCQQIENAEFAVIDGAGHVPCYEQGDAVNKAISTFMEKISLKKPAGCT
ncbi:MAG: alpha/beta fold hydrolase [Granulosicoccus sp.]